MSTSTMWLLLFVVVALALLVAALTKFSHQPCLSRLPRSFQYHRFALLTGFPVY